MKKLFSLLLLSAATAGSVMAQTVSAPQYEWGNLFDGKTAAGDQSQAISISPSGDVYWHNVGGSTESAPYIYYADEFLFNGVPYNAGTSYNNNLCILKTDAEGKLLWNLHSISCDFATNDGRVAATSDHGAIFTARVRHTEGMHESPLQIVDGQGNTHTFEWSTDRRYYRVIVGRLDADGNLLWTRFIDCDTAPAPAAAGNYFDFTAEALSIPALSLDNNDNIYIGGNFRSDMHLPTADGELVLSPRNVSSWSGDPQSNAGGMYLVKLNPEGYALSSLSVEGEAEKETVNTLTWSNGYLYFHALVNGEDKELNIGGYSFIPQGDFSPLVGKLDSNLAISWLTPMKGEKVGGKYGFQNCNISICDNNLWFVGMFNGMVSDEEGTPLFTSTQGNMREGFLARINANTGECEKGVTSRTSFSGNVLTGYLRAIQNPFAPSKVYVYGYGMNATTGVFLRPYDVSTLEADPESAWTLASQGGVPSAVTCEYDMDSKSLYFTARGNKPFKCEDTVVGENSTWALLMGKYTLPESDFPTSVIDSPVEESSLSLYPGKGVLHISSVQPTDVSIFNITGELVKNERIDNSAAILLPAGLYIVAGRKVLIR